MPPGQLQENSDNSGVSPIHFSRNLYARGRTSTPKAHKPCEYLRRLWGTIDARRRLFWQLPILKSLVRLKNMSAVSHTPTTQTQRVRSPHKGVTAPVDRNFLEFTPAVPYPGYCTSPHAISARPARNATHSVAGGRGRNVQPFPLDYGVTPPMRPAVARTKLFFKSPEICESRANRERVELKPNNLLNAILHPRGAVFTILLLWINRQNAGLAGKKHFRIKQAVWYK